MKIVLPEPQRDGRLSLEQCLARRRSIRHFSRKPIALRQVSQLLWAAQGITSPSGYRTAPSAGALYPLEMYAAAGLVEDLSAGVYHYRPRDHALVLIRQGDVRPVLTESALGQSAVNFGAATLAIAAVFERTTGKYGRRGRQYVHLDAGHAAQNICLQATALGLGTVPIGAFHDDMVAKTLHLPGDQVPLYLLPVGMP
ncbi:MAG: SagB/ThcOx family dehydrogenase [Desulfobulbaceae bacterium]|jgi:SagB-type dehydrogenase family enzyme|nr:SagB/ThcOx family dehydrogenase [Desulfobulbaceae bacterium]MDY0349688.1 SagB/ThcOx family dehydrogenase [Desulfobulbaceae bacterium]